MAKNADDFFDAPRQHRPRESAARVESTVSFGSLTGTLDVPVSSGLGEVRLRSVT